MPRDGSNQFHVLPGTDGITNYTLESTKYNGFIHDVEQDLNLPRPIVAGGTGATSPVDARTNLQAERAMAGPVTNYASQVWENGSFWSAAAPDQPVSGHTFGGTAIVVNNDQNNVVLDVRDLTDTGSPTTQLQRKYTRVKVSGIWGPWFTEPIHTVYSGSDGWSNVNSDMFYGVTGTSPNSFFIINTKADVTGTNLFTVGKGGTVSINSLPSNSSQLSLIAPVGNFGNLFTGMKGATPRWQIALGNGGTESGGNLASDFALARFNDAGTLIDNPITVSRSTADTSFAGRVLVSNNVQSASTPTTGAYFFGTSGAKVLLYDGANFQLTGGPLTVLGVGTSPLPPAGVLKVSFNNTSETVGLAIRTAVDSAYAAAFYNAAGTNVGGIITAAAATSFATSSDDRLKEDLKSFDAGNIIDGTNVYDFAWKSTGERTYGVIAQQASEVYPAAVAYKKDEDWWGIDYSKYVPVLLQELKALRARVAQLEAGIGTKPAHA